MTIEELTGMLEFILQTLQDNHQHHLDYDDYGDYEGSALYLDNKQAIAAIEGALS